MIALTSRSVCAGLSRCDCQPASLKQGGLEERLVAKEPLNVPRQDFRLFFGCKVAALGEGAPLLNIVQGLHPASGRLCDLLGKVRNGRRHLLIDKDLLLDLGPLYRHVHAFSHIMQYNLAHND